MRTVILLLVFSILTLNPASASPFSEKQVQPAKEPLQEAASASKDFVKDKFAILKK